jgi:hypothetical protein
MLESESQPRKQKEPMCVTAVLERSSELRADASRKALLLISARLDGKRTVVSDVHL